MVIRRAAGSSLLRILGLLAVGPVLAAHAHAQQPAGTMIGVVTDAHGQPLTSAEVVVGGTQIRALTTRGGHFQLTRVPAGTQTLEVRFVGYETAVLPVRIVVDEVLRMEVRLELRPVELEQVDVDAVRELSPALQGFYERRSRGIGHFFTDQEIQATQVRAVTDLLRRVPGLNVSHPAGGRYGTGQTAQMSRSTGIAGARPCPVLYFLNGQLFPIHRDVGINHFVRPDEIAAVEVYAGTSRVPSQFDASGHNSRCGVIAIWTHSGRRR